MRAAVSCAGIQTSRPACSTMRFGSISGRQSETKRPLDLETEETAIRVAEAVELHAHPVHDRQVHAAQLAVAITLVPVIQHAPRLQRPAQTARQQDRQLAVVVL